MTDARPPEANFSAFADLLLSYPRCAREMHFVFVPGPADPFDVSNLLLPRSALPVILTKDLRAKLPKVSFTTSPCRITYKSQEIVVFREDTMSRMLRNTVRLKNDLSTLADQGVLDILEASALGKGQWNDKADMTSLMEQEEWSDQQKGEARLKVLSQFVSGGK